MHGSLHSEDVSISLQALWLLCGVGAVVFSAGAPGWRQIGALVSAFGLTAWLFRGGVPDAASVAGLAAVVAGCKLYRPAWKTLPAFAAGLLAGVLGLLLEFQGSPRFLALALAASIPAATVWLSRGPNFAPEIIVEEGMLMVLILGLGAAVGPAILEGWRSAGALNIAPGAENLHFPEWVLTVAAGSTLIGGAWSVWRHR